MTVRCHTGFQSPFAARIAALLLGPIWAEFGRRGSLVCCGSRAECAGWENLV